MVVARRPRAKVAAGAADEASEAVSWSLGSGTDLDVEARQSKQTDKDAGNIVIVPRKRVPEHGLLCAYGHERGVIIRRHSLSQLDVTVRHSSGSRSCQAVGQPTGEELEPNRQVHIALAHPLDRSVERGPVGHSEHAVGT